MTERCGRRHTATRCLHVSATLLTSLKRVNRGLTGLALIFVSCYTSLMLDGLALIGMPVWQTMTVRFGACSSDARHCLKEESIAIYSRWAHRDSSLKSRGEYVLKIKWLG